MKTFDGVKSEHCCSQCSTFITLILIISIIIILIPTVNCVETDLHYWPGFRCCVSVVGFVFRYYEFNVFCPVQWNETFYHPNTNGWISAGFIVKTLVLIVC